MNESEYSVGEFTDDLLDALADAGDFLNEEEGSYDQLTDAQLDRLANYGQRRGLYGPAPGLPRAICGMNVAQRFADGS